MNDRRTRIGHDGSGVADGCRDRPVEVFDPRTCVRVESVVRALTSWQVGPPCYRRPGTRPHALTHLMSCQSGVGGVREQREGWQWRVRFRVTWHTA